MTDTEKLEERLAELLKTYEQLGSVILTSNDPKRVEAAIRLRDSCSSEIVKTRRELNK